MSESREHVRQHHRDERLVFDKKYPFVADIGRHLQRNIEVRLEYVAFRWIRSVFVRHAQGASQSARLPVEVHETAELPFDACDNSPASIAATVGWADLRSARLCPNKLKFSGLGLPDEFDVTRVDGQSSIFRRVCSEFVQRQGNRLCCRRRQQNDGPAGFDAFVPARAIGGKLFFHEPGEVGALPARSREQPVCVRQRPDPAIKGTNVFVNTIGAGQDA